MNRGTILNIVFKACGDQNIQSEIREILITNANPSAKRRSIFITDLITAEVANTEEKIREHFENYNAGYEVQILNHGTVQTPNFSTDFIPLSNNQLENNWRCRLISAKQIDFENEASFNSLAMKATWRIIVSHKDGEFFVRRDIYPFIWSPGHSVAGFEHFESQVTSELNFLNDPRARAVDEFNDQVKAFALLNGQSASPVIDDGVLVSELRANFDSRKEQFLEAFRQYFIANSTQSP